MFRLLFQPTSLLPPPPPPPPPKKKKKPTKIVYIINFLFQAWLFYSNKKMTKSTQQNYKTSN